MLERVKEQDPSIRRGQITATFKKSKTVRGLERMALKHMWLNKRSDPDVIVIEHVRARKCFVKRQRLSSLGGPGKTVSGQAHHNRENQPRYNNFHRYDS